MLRCVDTPIGHRRSDGTHSSTYDKVYNDSDGYCSRLSESDSAQKHDSIHSEKSDSKNTKSSPEIAKRPPMKTPDISSSSTDEDEDGDRYPSTGLELMKGLEERIKARDSRGLIATVPKSDEFERGRLQPPNPNKKPTKKLTKTMKPAKPGEVKGTSSDEDYDYTSINDIPRPLTDMKPASPSKLHRKSALSSECFQSIKVKVVDPINNPLGIGAQFEWKTYLSSTAFFTQFAESFYEWSQKLDRGLQDASAYKSAICCTLTKPAKNCQYKTTVEFLPVIPVPEWPEIAIEWKLRKRVAVLDKWTNINYTWPRASQVESITKQGCHLMTEGGKFRGRFSPNFKLEWQLSFGIAHETLINSLGESHLQALLWARLIFRHVVAPIGILTQYHLDTVFLWMVEDNYINWLEVSLGEKISDIFQALHDAVRQRKLLHYFIRKRNLLQSKEPKDIIKAQERLFRLKERFLPFVMQTAKQLQTSNTIFPLPDFDRLWEIVTTQMSLASINPGLAATSKSLSTSSASIEEKKKKTGKNKSGDEKEGFWETVTKPTQSTGDKTRDLLRKERAKIDAEEREKRPVSEEVEKTDFVLTSFSAVQLKLLLEFFIEHFIHMVQASNRIRAYKKSTVLLDQAFNLTVLLGEEGYDAAAENYFDIIKSLRIPVYQGQFYEPYVDIPGSPCVFPTGVEKTRLSSISGLSRHSNLSNGVRPASRPSVPLPETPVERLFNKSNGHVIQRSTSEPGTTDMVKSNGSVVMTTAVIENAQSSELETSDQFESPSPFSRAAHVEESDSELDESTDF